MTNPLNPFDWQSGPPQVEFPKHRSYTKGVMPPSIGLVRESSQCIAQLDLAGNVLNLYPSISSAARDLGLSAYYIRCCLQGKKESTGGFAFKPHARHGVKS